MAVSSILLRPTWVRYQVLAVACSLAVLTYVQRQGFVAGSPYIKKDLGLTDTQMGYLASIWLIAYGAFQVPIGLLGDRLGARHLLTILVVAWSLMAGAVAFTSGLPSGWNVFAILLVLRFLFGMLQAGGFPILARVTADWMPKQQRGFAQGMVWTFSRLGGFVAPLLVFWLLRDVFSDDGIWPVEAVANWVPPLWIIAGLGLVWCALFWPWFRNKPAEVVQVNDAERRLIHGPDDIAPTAIQELPPSTSTVPIWRRFVTSPSVWALCLMYGFQGFAGNFITSLLPIYLRNRRLSEEATAWISGLPLAFGIISCLSGGVLSDWLIHLTGSRKWGRRLVGIVVLLSAGVTAVSPIFADDVWLLGLAFSAWFLFSDANMGPAWASCADVGERYAGSLSGAMNMTGSLFGAIGMWLAGRCFDHHLDDVIFIAFGYSYALAALCWLVIDVTKPLVPRHRD